MVVIGSWLPFSSASPEISNPGEFVTTINCESGLLLGVVSCDMTDSEEGPGPSFLDSGVLASTDSEPLTDGLCVLD